MPFEVTLSSHLLALSMILIKVLLNEGMNCFDAIKNHKNLSISLEAYLGKVDEKKLL